MPFKIRVWAALLVSGLLLGCTHTSQRSVVEDQPIFSGTTFPSDRLIRIVPTSLSPVLDFADSSIHGHAIVLNTPRYLITVSHVVSGSQALTFVDNAGNEHTPRQIRFHPSLDLSVIELTDSIFVSPLSLLKTQPILDETTVLYSTHRNGDTLSTLSGTIIHVNAASSTLTTTLSLLPGMSGGPVVDDQGHLIGVNKARVTTEESELLWLTEEVRKRINETVTSKN